MNEEDELELATVSFSPSAERIKASSPIETDPGREGSIASVRVAS